MAPKKLSLETIGGGELAVIAERELSAICESIADPNVKAEAVRELTIKVKVKPDSKRQTAEIAYEVKSKLPGASTCKTTAFIAMDKGELFLYGADVRQSEMFNHQAEPLVSEIRPSTRPVSEGDVKPATSFTPPINTN